MKNKINILGTDYLIKTEKISENKDLKNNGYTAYCNKITHEIIISDKTEEKYFSNYSPEEQELANKKDLRHEIIHAFLNESGLQSNTFSYDGGWSECEEMVDWISLQFSKIYAVYKELDLI